jgi:hypothetical protein
MKYSTCKNMCERKPALKASFYDTMCDWQNTVGLGRKPGPGERDRTRGKADKSEGASKPKKRPRGNENDGGTKCKVMRKTAPPRSGVPSPRQF